jgi:L-lactate dehydrogenase (cytochrome)
MSSRASFESVAEAQRLARRRVPTAVYAQVLAGMEQGLTRDANVTAFNDLGFVPRVGIVAGLPGAREQATSVVGERISLPVIIAPTGAHGIHPQAELAVARAAARAGTAICLSSFASKAIEDVVEANPQTFFQLYWIGGRDRVRAVVERASGAGAKALMVTLDKIFAHRRDWGIPPSPVSLARVTLPVMARHFGLQAITHPRWLFGQLGIGIPRFTVPNLGPSGQPPPAFFNIYQEWMRTPLPTWSDVAWLREQWRGPLVVKGIAHPDDAREAVKIGAEAVSVSNHGGNNLDGTVASIRLLPAIVDAVGDEIEILLDGGIRRGSDVVKALAFGARAVLIGRAYLWGLAANGEDGVANVLDILRAGIDETLIGLGRDSIHDLVSEDVVVPPGFAVEPPYDRARRSQLMRG